MDNIQEGELLNIVALIKKSELQSARKIKVSFYQTLEEEKVSHEIDFDPSMITKDDDFVFSLAAKELIK